jgi:YD repeat-containing protein
MRWIFLVLNAFVQCGVSAQVFSDCSDVERDLCLLMRERLPSGSHLFYQYDLHGRLVSIIVTDSSERTIHGRISIDYDEMDQRAHLMRIFMEDGEGNVIDDESFVYDDVGDNLSFGFISSKSRKISHFSSREIAEDAISERKNGKDREKILDFERIEPKTQVNMFTHLEADERKKNAEIAWINKITPYASPEIALKSIGNPFKVYSHARDIGCNDLVNGGIGFVNGINNSLEIAEEHALRLSQYANGTKIHHVYNATHSLTVDLFECVLGHFRIPTPPVKLLKKQWNDFIATHPPDAKFLQICHSYGASLVKLGLISSPPAVRERIIVLSIAPGTIIPSGLAYQVYHYVSKRDFVSKLDLKSNLLDGSQLIFLEPHEEAPLWDHDFSSPTYRDVIERHMMDYLRGCLYTQTTSRIGL